MKPSEHAGAQGGASCGETIGPAQDCHPDLRSWAFQTENLDCLNKVVRVSGASRDTHLGICLHFLAKPSVGGLLFNWQDEDPVEHSLNRLAEDIRSNDWLLGSYPTVPASKPLAEQFHGEVEQHQLLLMLAVRRPGTDPELQDWFDALRLWTLLQALRRQQGSQDRDELVEFVASKLRLAADIGSHWLNLVNKLRGSTDSEESISRHLRWASDRWLALESGEPRRFLQHLGRVARGDAKSIRLSDLAADYARGFRPCNSPPSKEGFDGEPDLSWNDFEVADDQPPPMNPTVGAWTARTAADASFSRRSLTGRGVLLRSAEQLQFLPWSWHKPTPLETDMLWTAIQKWEGATDATLQMLGLITRIAIYTSRSMRLVVSISVSEEPTDDWTINANFDTLQRRAPRRSPRWHAEERHQDWIHPLEPVISISLAPQPLPLSTGATAHTVTELGDLWKQVSADASAEEAFNTVCQQTAGLQRLSSGQLSDILAHSIYTVSNDAVLAQVLTARRRTGLGGSCAYASWPVTKVGALPPFKNSAAIASAEHSNAAGSELDPLDDALRRAIGAATAEIERLSQQPNKWIKHHNALTIYVVTALLAGSGARPVNDPFESPAMFDWQRFRVFLSDKTSTAGTGRVVPLPPTLFRLLTETYLTHLQTLANRLQPFALPLASEIARLAQKAESQHMPLFFLLRDQPCLGWNSVTERAMETFGLFNWPLPANLMRHRLSTRLRALGIDPEIIDSLLGHADHGVLTHGDESPRTWLVDMQATQAALDEAYARLGFATELTAGSFPQVPLMRIEADQLLSRSRQFGAAARATGRRASLRKALRNAASVMRTKLSKRPPESLSAADWDAMAVEVLTIQGKRPHPFGAKRFELLQRWQAKLSQTKKLTLSRVFAIDKAISTPFTDRAMWAESVVADHARWFAGVIENQPPSKTSSRHAIALATLDVLITCRVTATAVLADLMRLKNVRVVLHRARTYLEHHPLLSDYPDAPVTRYRIALRCAQWIDMAANSTYVLDVSNWKVPDHWLKNLPSVPEPGSVALGTLVRRLAASVQQLNYLDRPGLVAGYLSGRLPCAALPHAAWLLQSSNLVKTKLTTQEAVSPEPPDISATEIEEELLPVRLPTTKRSTATTRNQQSDAAALLAIFRRELAAFGRTEGSARSRPARRDLVNALRKHLESKAECISSAIWGFFAWITTLAGQPRKKNTPYAISSVLRYLAATGQRFVEVGCDFDLIRADTDAITDFYDEVLEIKRDLDLHYVMDRLQAFHRFMCREFAVADADWDELDSGSSVPHGSPGTLGQPQYDNALKLLADRPSRRSDQDLACAALLILAFRFGLRGNDVIGLLLKDCWSRGQMAVVLVRPNGLRQLKRPSSRRVVPLVETLSRRETAVLLRFQERAMGLGEGKDDFALFALDTAGQCFDLADLRQRINTVLKLVCDDPTITLHKARHAYAIRIADYLLSEMLFAPGTVNEVVTDPTLIDHAKKLLLTSVHPTRRACWAISRLLGHWRPRTSFKSYIHQLPQWADSWNVALIDRLDVGQSSDLLSHAVRLDEALCRLWEPLPTAVSATPLDTSVSPDAVVAYLGLLRRNVTSASARRSARINRDVAETLGLALDRVTETLRNRTERADRPALTSLLHQIGDVEWHNLAQCCREATSRWSVLDGQTPAVSLDAGLQVLTENRQLLMWRAAHFKWVTAFVHVFGLGKDDLCLARSRRVHVTVLSWLYESRLEEFCSTNGPAILQLDTAVEGDPPQLFPHRCAVVVRPGPEGCLRTGYGLALLWVVFVVCATADASLRSSSLD